MNAVLKTPIHAAGRSGARCTRCGVSRPVGHAHCYVCGARLGGTGSEKRRAGWRGALRAVATWRASLGAWRPSRRRPVAGTVPAGAPPVQLRPLTRTLSPPRIQLRTMGDRAARWYVALSLVGMALWYFKGPSLTVPVAAGAPPTEACTWLDTQRLHVTEEVTRMTDPYRPMIAQRLNDLASLIGSGGTPG